MASISLLSTTARVEAPFIHLKIGKYAFGVATKDSDVNLLSRAITSKYYFPNYMKSIEVKKINGVVNTYTINMIYVIRPGDDPNFLEKVFSSISDDRKIKISYGDCSLPTFFYKEEEAIITNIKSDMNVSACSISYTLTCTGVGSNANVGTWNFKSRFEQPSVVIKELLYTAKYGLKELFSGMQNKSLVLAKGLIAADDKKVLIRAQNGKTVLEYLNYLVSCMSSVTDGLGILKGSKYVLTFDDDIKSEFGGPYFKVSKISTMFRSSGSSDIYEVDVNFPGQNNVLGFSLDDNETYSILYNYAGKVDQPDYIYKIDNKGDLQQVYSPILSNSKKYLETTESDKTWWTQVTQYPISGKLVIKGLLRPAILMTYVKINVYFYGRKHLSSGYYIITNQVDSVDGNGYKTTLTVTRVKGDDEAVNV